MSHNPLHDHCRLCHDLASRCKQIATTHSIYEQSDGAPNSRVFPAEARSSGCMTSSVHTRGSQCRETPDSYSADVRVSRAVPSEAGGESACTGVPLSALRDPDSAATAGLYPGPGHGRSCSSEVVCCIRSAALRGRLEVRPEEPIAAGMPGVAAGTRRVSAPC